MKIIVLVACLLFMTISVSGQWNISGTHAYNTNTGNVGIGTTSPAFKLDVNGNLRTTSFAAIREYLTVDNGGSYRVALNGQSDGYITARNSNGEDKFTITTNGNSYFNGGNIGIGITNPLNKLQIGPNPQGWNGNDLVISNTINGIANSTQVLISNALDHTMIYGSTDIAIRPGFGKWSIYAKGGNAYVGIGHNDPVAMLHVAQVNNSDWASIISNAGGSGKGLKIIGTSGDNTTPLLQIDENNNLTRFLVRGDGYVGVGTSSPQYKLHVAGSGFFQQRLTVQGVIPNDNNAAFVNNDVSGYGIYSKGGLNTHYSFHFENQAGSSIMFGGGNGNVGIGTTYPDAKLAVKGTVHAEEVKVDLNVPGPDYVFEPTYQLPTLTEIENYIKINKHLPEVPSAKEMETNGINLSEMNMLLLKKVEELTLHLIEQQKEINLLKSKIK